MGVKVNFVRTPENGFLTAAMKLNRNPVKEAFKKEIAALYE
jgi:long-subunit acyl-CoA synthetase (AMP-forming)